MKKASLDGDAFRLCTGGLYLPAFFASYRCACGDTLDRKCSEFSLSSQFDVLYFLSEAILSRTGLFMQDYFSRCTFK